ncbi:MAG: hypothetical protein P1U56_23095 [Saprospiraceae bacterium]|nr:hypothetical protein [Saprospiraceae bacterium]
MILLLIGILLFSCNSKKDLRPKDANLKCNDFYVQGEFKQGVHTFCGIIPIEIEYSYKVGYWKYWSLNGTLVAQGKYKLEKSIIDDRGGCSYEVMVGTIVKDQWLFRDEKGHQFVPNDGFVEELESCVIEMLN